MSPEQALAFSKQKILRFWGLTGQRGWARLILDRLHDLVLSPDVFFLVLLVIDSEYSQSARQ
jgi:hypothetical protein